MEKYCLDLRVADREQLSPHHVLLKLTSDEALPHTLPGQFVNLRADQGGRPLLRRPISINFQDYDDNTLWLLIAAVGEGTCYLCSLQKGDVVNCLFPLGRPFSEPEKVDSHVLLVGGGVGVAPMLMQGAHLAGLGHSVTFLLGAKTKDDLLELSLFEKWGDVKITTEDGSLGERGFVTNHSVLQEQEFDLIQTCGPTPMMKAVAKYARQSDTTCEVSLENLMACGLGACLCCVEKTVDGNLCVCKDGPVFNINKLLW